MKRDSMGFGKQQHGSCRFFNDYENLLGQCSFSGGCNGDTIDQQYNGGSVWIYGVESLLSTQIAITNNFHCPFQQRTR